MTLHPASEASARAGAEVPGRIRTGIEAGIEAGTEAEVATASPVPPPLRIKAKVDTGARTSALHAEDVEHFERDGAGWVRFTVLPRQRTREGAVVIEAPRVDRRRVRSSSGEAQERTVVRLGLQLGEETFEAEVTLARRDRMGFRMLLGRTALRGRFVVDPAVSWLQGRLSSTDTPA